MDASRGNNSATIGPFPTMSDSISARIPGVVGECFALYAHPTRRSTVKASRDIEPGTVIFTEYPAALVLAESQKGKRCDACYRWRPETLIQCTGCREMWYCDTVCQRRSWDAHHSKLCMHLPTFATAAGKVTGFQPDQQTLASVRKDVILLLQLVATTYDTPAKLGYVLDRDPGQTINDETDFASPSSVFASLRPQGYQPRFPVPTPLFPFLTSEVPSDPRLWDQSLRFLAHRFHNNNFGCWLSNMDPIADAVYPLASRLFNHSCRPNSVVVYEITDRGLLMEIRALRRISSTDEITIAYLDPAIWLPARQKMLTLTYNFDCDCPKCHGETRLAPFMGNMPSAKRERLNVNNHLRQFMLNTLTTDIAPSKEVPRIPPLPIQRFIEEVPQHLLTAFNSTYLAEVAKRFSNQSHDGPFDRATRTGKLVLAIYLVHYGQNWPMIGIHCYELSKTIWNWYTSVNDASVKKRLLYEALTFATWSRNVLQRSVARLGDGGSATPPADDAERFEELILEEWSRIGI